MLAPNLSEGVRIHFKSTRKLYNVLIISRGIVFELMAILKFY